MLFSMKQTCEKTGMTYEALKFYCNQGLVPNVKRDAGNRRVFDELDIAWIESLGCLKRCGLSIQEMRYYVQLCQQGTASIPERKVILAQKREALLEQIASWKTRWLMLIRSKNSTTTFWREDSPMSATC